MRINIKPLSVNSAWNTYCNRCKQAKTVKRTKTDKYKGFATELSLKLPPLKLEFKGEISICITVGFSSKGSDLDNIAKPLLDVLSRKYGFNDNQIYEMQLKKEIVKKGNEFLDIKINEI